MTIYFNVLNFSSTSKLKQTLFSSLSAQQKKIALVVAIAFSFLAACYCVFPLINSYSLNKQSPLNNIKNIPDNSLLDTSAIQKIPDPDLNGLDQAQAINRKDEIYDNSIPNNSDISNFDLNNLEQAINRKDVSFILKFLSQKGAEVKELNLEFLLLTDNLLDWIIKHCPNLEKLSLESDYITDTGVESLQALACLQTLSLRNCPHVTKQGINSLKAANPLLTLII